MKIDYRADVFDDPEYCKDISGECEYLDRMENFPGTPYCNQFLESLDILSAFKPMKCEECKEYYNKAKGLPFKCARCKDEIYTKMMTSITNNIPNLDPDGVYYKLAKSVCTFYSEEYAKLYSEIDKLADNDLYRKSTNT